ncbi:unnamed protein product [Rotaria sordida]|uniref:Small ribosomal subunit protein uS7 domain-containing protein n=1 Tax=Rotaria sordida TaxID=392033 RepID=A0A818P447_9BILA|nr:unnamed protein product [Rotaria sordida]
MRIVEDAFYIIYHRTGENPVQILIDAVINSGVRQNLIRMDRFGLNRGETIDTSPLQRINQPVSSLCTGARNSSFKSIKTISECLADELINASKQSYLSFAVRRKDQLEGVQRQYD